MSGDDVDDELAALREQTDTGDRVDSAAKEQSASSEPTLEESIREERAAIDAGDRQATISAWDGDLAAFILALGRGEHVDKLEDVTTALAHELGTEPPSEPRKSDVLRLAARLGLEELPTDAREQYRSALE